MDIKKGVAQLSTKENILALFEENKGIYFSGEEIAAQLSVSRAAVWKAVNALRSDGYVIDAVPNKGYRLSMNTDILSVQGIEKYLDPQNRQLTIQVLPEVSSTNTMLREKANEEIPEGYVIIANGQTEGRGRRGRSFYSPVDTGIYLSILLRPKEIATNELTNLTSLAAVAACETIEEVSGQTPGIKWVNDIYIDGRKVSGILTEASISMENGSVEYVVVGIGFNVYLPEDGFSGEIKDIAGAIFDRKKDDGKNLLVAGVLNHFMNYYAEFDKKDYVKKYQERSLVVGKEITVLAPSGSRKALALEVDDTCALLVQYEDGSTERLNSGEISIRGVL